MHNQADQIHDRSRRAGNHRQLFLAKLSGKFGRKRGTNHEHRDRPGQGGHGLRGRALIIVREHIAGHALHRQHRKKQRDSSGDNAEQ